MDGEARAELGQVLPSLGPRPASAPVERFRIHRAVRELLETLAATKPLVLLLDDLHGPTPARSSCSGCCCAGLLGAAVMLAMTVRPRQVSERLSGALERAHRAGTLSARRPRGR